MSDSASIPDPVRHRIQRQLKRMPPELITGVYDTPMVDGQVDFELLRDLLDLVGPKAAGAVLHIHADGISKDELL